KLYEQTNEPARAITAFNETLKANPVAASVHVELARLYLAIDDPKNATRAADEALRVNADDPELRMLLARSLLRSGDLGRAETEIERLSGTHPQLATVHVLAGAMFVARQNAPAARRAFERALELDRDNFDALSELVTLHAEANQLDDARRLIESRLARAPNNTALLVLAARTYATSGDLTTAERLLNRVIAQDSGNFSAYG